MALSRSEFEAHFEPAVLDQEGVLNECISVCTTFNLSPEDLYYRWEAFSYSSSERDRVVSSLTLEGAKALHGHLQRQEQERHRAKQNVMSTPVAKQRIGILPKSIARNFPQAKLSASPSPLATPRRPPQGTRTVPESPTVSHTPRVKYTLPVALSEFNYRYMYEKITDRSEVLDERIDNFGEVVKSHYNLNDLGDPTIISETESVVVGRICCDADAKLNESSILLESSRMMGSGRRVPVAFLTNCSLRSEIVNRGGFGFFPGQMVALKGKNGDGTRFVVSEILATPSLPPQSLTSSHDDSTSVVVATGPYSSSKDLAYEPFDSLLKHAERLRPRALILLGPFVDANNDLIRTGNITQTPTETFQSQVVNKLESLHSGSMSSLSIFLIPSPQDFVHNHLAYPQNILPKEKLHLPDSIHLLPNPAVFSINGVTIGATSVDVVAHLNSQQYFKRAPSTSSPPTSTSATPAIHQVIDPMYLVCRHLLEQRTFYPLFPVPHAESSSVNLDVSHSDLLQFDYQPQKQDMLDDASEENPGSPNILILPSRLKSFSKIIDSTVVINPSYIARGGSSFAHVQIPSTKSVNLDPSVLAQQVKVEIIPLVKKEKMEVKG